MPPSPEPSNVALDITHIIKYDPFLYFPDGNIVLAAAGPVQNPGRYDSDSESEDGSSIDSEEARKTVTLFRIHRSLLSMHSRVFRDMFALCSEGSGGQTWDGVPFIPMFDDDAQDASNFLRVIYDPHFVPADLYDFEYHRIMLGPLKLADEYEVEGMKNQVISRVKSAWPSRSHREWDDRDYMVAEHYNPSVADIEDAISLVVEGGIQDDVPEQLALMYYHLSTYSERNDFENINSEHFRVLFRGRQNLNRDMLEWTKVRFSDCLGFTSDGSEKCARASLHMKFVAAFVSADDPLACLCEAAWRCEDGDEVFGAKLCLDCLASVLWHLNHTYRYSCFKAIKKHFAHP
ncbi:hypothetical protein HGRIS_011864 [Hohenbuehelia grisea]|uniref:BTB domain-containing protein n=1 Tax=Hohenbuehelia grisea TaxID=104357 RepID=A0ABR3JWD9_9AGAR